MTHDNLSTQLIETCYFFSVSTFNLAHWLFAYSYLVLSFKIELMAKDLPEDTHNFRLTTLNIIVCLLNVIIPAILWGCIVNGKTRVESIAFSIV